MKKSIYILTFVACFFIFQNLVIFGANPPLVKNERSVSMPNIFDKLWGFLTSLFVSNNQNSVKSFPKKTTPSPHPIASITPSLQTQSLGATIFPSKDVSSNTSTALNIRALPLGDGKISTLPQKGYVYLCNNSVNPNAGGAQSAGPWIDRANKTWDISQKIVVDGNISWPSARFQLNYNSDFLQLTSNGLPTTHHTGIYPVSSQDDAYQFDRNPNQIKSQNISLSLPKNPTLLSAAQCIGGEVGIMTGGVALFNAFDAGNRDAPAWEVQDNCDGHPQVNGVYHYHSLSRCLATASHELIGYGLDGFGIYNNTDENGQEIVSNDLDECHGHAHDVNWHGKVQNIFHYHMTRDFPYSVTCFRAKPVVRQVTSSSEGQNSSSRPPPPRR